MQKVSQKVAQKLEINTAKLVEDAVADVNKFVKVRSWFDLILGRFASPEIRNLFPALNVYYRLINGGALTESLIKAIETIEQKALYFVQNPEKAKELFNNFWRYGDA
ncbi:MAG: hypothetical protein ACO2OO_02290, partial [Candidatus Aenigmatarchaeota archaeon]